MRLYFILTIILFSAVNCVPLEKHSDKPLFTISHPVSFSGIVTSAEYTNIDKSGRNPRFMLHFDLKVLSFDDGGYSTPPVSKARFVIRENDLIKQTGRRIKTGEKVSITAHIMEKIPEVIAVHTIRVE